MRVSLQMNPDSALNLCSRSALRMFFRIVEQPVLGELDAGPESRVDSDRGHASVLSRVLIVA